MDNIDPEKTGTGQFDPLCGFPKLYFLQRG